MEKKIEQILKETIASYGVNAEVTAETAIADLGLDSIDAADFMFQIEEKFDIVFSDDITESVNTVGDLIAKIEQLSEK